MCTFQVSDVSEILFLLFLAFTLDDKRRRWCCPPKSPLTLPTVICAVLSCLLVHDTSSAYLLDVSILAFWHWHVVALSSTS